jgi:ABC-type uncharacterized transport system ATPase subunit
MKVLFGIVQVDADRIVFRGTELSRAIALGIDMVHQQSTGYAPGLQIKSPA